MVRHFAVDSNRVIEGSLIRANDSRAVAGDEFEVGMTLVGGGDFRGVVLAEVVELDHSSESMVL